MQTFVLKQNDTSPAIQAILKNPDGSVINLDGADVCFNMRSSRGEQIINRALVTVLDATNGLVRYEWIAADTAVSGNYQAEFEITFSNGQVESVPNSESLSIKIIPDLG